MRRIFLILMACLACFLFTAAVYAEKTDKTTPSKSSINIDQPVETITKAEMEQRLLQGTAGDVLYLKINDDRVEVYTDISKDRSLRKQIILNAPAEEMLRLYSNNKETAIQMSRMLTDYEADNKNINGYRVITDMDQPKKLENGQKIYRLWFMKIKREKESRRSFPIGIGIGIGIGGHHDGPYIGIGL